MTYKPLRLIPKYNTDLNVYNKSDVSCYIINVLTTKKKTFLYYKGGGHIKLYSRKNKREKTGFNKKKKKIIKF